MTELGPSWTREDLGGGRFQATIGLRPTAYLENGMYRAIVNDFVDGDENYPHIVTAAPMLISVAADGKRRIHPTREIDRYIEIGSPYIKPAATWQKVNLGAATRIGNRLQWTTTNAIVGIDMAGHFTKLGVLLRNGWQPPNGQFAFPVSLAGLTRNGGNLLADGIPVALLRPPYVEDYDNPLDIRPIAWDFVNVSDQNYILFSLPDLTGMSRPLIDPVVALDSPTYGEDTMIYNGAATFNYGIGTDIQVGYDSANKIARGLIRFDLSGIPNDSIINSASLSLYSWFEGNTTDFATRAHRAITQWYEGAKNGAVPDAGQNGSTWNLRNANGAVAWTGGAGGAAGSDWVALATASTVITGINATFTFDVKADVQSYVQGVANYGWWMRNEQEAAVSDKHFRSSEHATPAQRPSLSVDYTLPVTNSYWNLLTRLCP